MISLALLLGIHQKVIWAKRSVAFECTARQEEEDLAAIKAKEHRYHQSMVRLGLCALQHAEQRNVHDHLSRNAKISEGVQWLEKAAALGDPEAKNNLAILHSKGYGVGLPDPAKAHAYLMEAAGEGCADAQFNLGVLFDTGQNSVVTKDAAAAAHWFGQAANRNHFEATHALALMEVTGRGVPVDHERAAARFRKLAAPDVDPPYPNAQYMLALLALKGECSPDLLEGLALGSEEEEGGSQTASQQEYSGITIGGIAQPTIARAVRLLRRAAEAGHPQAQEQVKALLPESAVDLF